MDQHPPDILTIRNPWNGDPVGEAVLANETDADSACEASARSFAETRALPSWKRSEILLKIATALTERTEEFSRLIALEAGKPIRDARMEVARGVSVFRIAAEEARRIGGEVLPLDWAPGSDGRAALVRRVPIGPVLGITPFNFPLNLVAHKVAPAIACGAPILIKPASATPLTALRLGDLVKEAGYPAGAMAVLPCRDEIAGRLLADARLRKLSFTGSAKIGWMLKAAAGRKHVTLELGGNAAVVLHSDADLERAIPRMVRGAYSYAGQSCISVQRVFAHRSLYETVVARLTELAQTLRVGDPMEEATDVGPMISEAAAVRAESWIHEAVAAGAVLHTGGQREGSTLTPAVLTDVPAGTTLDCEEAFAPLLTVRPYDEFSEAMEMVNASRYGLQAGVFTSQWPLIAEASRTLDVGAVLINEVPTWRADHMPYGGVKESGFGREGVVSAIHAMTEERLLILDF